MPKKNKLWRKFRANFKERLPQGMTEFNQFVEDIADLSGLPMNDQLKKVSAMFVLQLPPVVSSVSKRYIISQLQKAAANQVSVAVLAEIENKANIDETKDKASIESAN